MWGRPREAAAANKTGMDCAPHSDSGTNVDVVVTCGMLDGVGRGARMQDSSGLRTLASVSARGDARRDPRPEQGWSGAACHPVALRCSSPGGDVLGFLSRRTRWGRSGLDFQLGEARTPSNRLLNSRPATAHAEVAPLQNPCSAPALGDPSPRRSCRPIEPQEDS
jgi:hypothetical protein